MSKTIPAQLLADKAAASQTLCNLLKVGPLSGGSYMAFASLDLSVEYDDGEGPLTYVARTGVQASALVASADLGVDNAEAETLPPIDTFPLEGITQQQIDAGALDKCPWVLYRVNYRNLAAGHEILGSGTVGEMRSRQGMLTVVELRSLSQQLKQSIVELDSKTCRAKFGSQPVGTGGGVVEERFPCGFDLSTLWVAGTVTSVGGEPDLVFTDSALTEDAGHYVPGVVEWLTGDNTGQKQEVDSFAAGQVTLKFPTVNSIQTGDTFRIRQDCNKRARDETKGCKFWFGAEWVNHFRGEPDIPTGDTAALNTPGAGTSTGSIGGTGETHLE